MDKNMEVIGVDHGWSHVKTAATVFTTSIEENEAAEKSTVYLIGILILALKMALYQFFKFKSL